MLTIRYTHKMKRDVKRLQERGKDMNKLISTLALLAAGGSMPPQYRDHQLKGLLRGCRECHIAGESDWLLVYQIIKNDLILYATGTHSDLFDE